MAVTKKKLEELVKRMEKCRLSEADLVEKFLLGSGKGGQKINKTASCVYLKHLLTGFEVKCQKGRSRELNRYLARRKLCDKIEEVLRKEKGRKRQELEKIRRQQQRRSRRQKEKMVQEKRQRGATKYLRFPPSE